MRSVGCVLLGAFSLLACADAADPAPPATSETVAADARCTTAANEAATTVKASVDANLACAKDDDCVEVSFATSCFSTCTVVIASAGLPAYEDARKAAEARSCKDFAAAGCTLLPLACDPLPPPVCLAGRCVPRP